jgi:hypothetical protein
MMDASKAVLKYSDAKFTADGWIKILVREN